jgi:TolB-like protein
MLFMKRKEAILNGETYSKTVILNQVQKILESPLFKVSNILSKFLTYIINETISGRSDYLKEYNIAIGVLKKSVSFNPNQNGVVRVHARRLRDALDNYYITYGLENCCEIIIPKGGYIPHFRIFKSLKLKPVPAKKNCMPLPGEIVKMAVMPFKTFEVANSSLVLANNIGQLLSIEFARFPNFSVLSYYTTQQLQFKQTGIKEIAATYGIQYVLAGSIQFDPTRIYVFLQLINADTEIMIWSDSYTLDISTSDLFEVGNVVVYRAMNALKEFNELFSRQIFKGITKVELGSSVKKNVIDIRQTRRNKKTVSF